MEFLLPDIGEGVAEGEIVKWHVQPGEAVTEEQDFVEVMTDKATVMIPCPVDGVVDKLLAAEGDVVPVHVAIASFSSVTSGKLAGGHGAAAPAQAAKAANGAHTGNGSGTATALLDAPVVNDGRVLATPATRKHARTLGVDLRTVAGSGPRGRVTREDVERALSGVGSRSAAARPAAASSPQASPVLRPAIAAAPAEARPEIPPPTPLRMPADGEVEERVPLRGVRRKVAEAMARSKHTAAHYTYVEEVDVSELVAMRERMKPAAAAHGVKLTYLPFIIKAVCQALKKHPQLNAAMDDVNQEIVYKKYTHLGIAVDGPQGLVVPVLKHADLRNVLDLGRELSRLGESTRQGKLSPDDLQGSTFTITSAGHIGGLLATPILNYPEVAILGVHKIVKRPVVRNDQIVIGHVMYLSISLDHRVVDGADAARFMNDVVRLLEQPELFLLEGV
ncbi:MAG: 2-oxo acid dehydrogenase subunit E2 [Planctomycetes bacterium]|nr:2-oxo acid dehydrogenase subunit E2 [Planctomycetota bacterium]